MKKKIILSSVIIAVLIGATILILPHKLYDIITDYEPYTFDRVFQDEELKMKYGIGDKKSPEDYGFHSEEINMKSVYDSVNLNAWYVESSENVNKSIVLIHGRTSNRLKTMKYLELIRDTGLDTMYNVFIPDLRNSGKSEISRTLMGYKFAEDLAASLLFLKREKHQDTVVLYAFSMGAMAVMTALDRKELSDSLKKYNIYIEKMIFDSPLTNVYETLYYNANELGVPKLLFDQTFELMQKETQSFAGKMKMSVLIDRIGCPLIIFQSKADRSTPYPIFEKEYGLIKRDDIRLYLYDSLEHVQIYQNEKYKEEYTRRVGDFMREH